MGDLPPLFLERMSRLLGEEYPAFAASLAEPPMIGLRVNTLKITAEDLRAHLPFSLAPVLWCPTGFSLTPHPSPNNRGGEGGGSPLSIAALRDGDGLGVGSRRDGEGESVTPGKHPYHTAGLYYLQEPSAMVAAELLDPRPGERVLDISAAPGGKATHLAALLQNEGVLVANEIHPQRVWDLAENLERCGVRNAAITNETPERLAEHFGAFFDKVLLDAPCSGEGMFRKSGAARTAWSLRLVEGCMLRQIAILEAAAKLVRPGGKLAYSTCTFAPEENEGTLAQFLRTHPDFELLETPQFPGGAPGRPDWVGEGAPEELQRAVRLWPQRGAGEGHFVAVLERNPAIGSDDLSRDYKPAAVRNTDLSRDYKPVPKPLLQLYRDFYHDALIGIPGEENLASRGTYLYALPTGLPDLGRLRVIRPGWWLGTFKKARFEPSHALAMGLNIAEVRRAINLEVGRVEGGRAEAGKFLRGESFSNSGEEGWVLVTVDGYPLGWGKRVQGVVKNFYPHGLRRV